ncbi:ribosome biogenesis GTPase YlqF [Roseimaritima sediminicola]|uniref:ribosome biogenesis GTPase YlqF n=1 Tax=Roseimaritima sediminicola TaxID=2662066 RepID=UPI00129849DC|nr:ribosome biogenesis GTPase YlqF [Roseimaritima sediminicola]
MTIQWFPGHMHKARLEIEAVLPKVHVVLEVLDARIPFSSSNPMLEELRKAKPCLKVLAKSDLADEEMTTTWKRFLEQSENTRATAVSSEDVPSIRRLKPLAAQLVPERQGRPVTIMIAGIPNVGKSTLINYLAGRKIARTGNTPAITKSQQKVPIGDGFTLLDTPGVLWPKVENVNSSFRLALLGSVKETVMDYAEVGFFAAGYLLEHYPERLQRRYDLDALPDSALAALEAIGRRRGCLGKGNRVDLDRAGRILVTELRSGALGRVTLETPELMQREQLETARQAADKAASKAETKAARKERYRERSRARRKGS